MYTAARSESPISHPHLTHSQVDLTDEESAAKWLQSILSSQTLADADDVLLVNNAGMVTPIKRTGQGGEDTLHQHYTLNLIIPVLLSHVFVRETQSFEGRKPSCIFLLEQLKSVQRMECLLQLKSRA